MAGMDNQSEIYDLRSLLYTPNRDFLIRNNAHQVKIGDLDGKVVGLYFSASWCPPCQRFTPNFARVYEDSSARWNLEVVYISRDRDEESFKEYFSHMPWLAVPFSDIKTRKILSRSFIKWGIPHLVILDANRKVITVNGVRIIHDYVEEEALFTPESVEELVAKDTAAQDAQSLASLLVFGSQDFLISNNGNKVPVSELEGKIVGLYFAAKSDNLCVVFTSKLNQLYKEWKGRGGSFEIVFISLDNDENSFQEYFQGMPWLALPFNEKDCGKLCSYIGLDDFPMLTIIGPDGKTMNHNVVELIEELGIEAYPFSPEKVVEFSETVKARRESQTLESLLVTGGGGFVIGKGGVEVPVSELRGKNILLFFSVKWCRRSQAFMPKLIQAYHEIKDKDQDFEIIFISIDRDQASFETFFSGMPWLALSFLDEARKPLCRTFEINSTPKLVVFGPDGSVIAKEALDLLLIHGSNAYPFNKPHLEKLELSLARRPQREVQHAAHATHGLVLTRRNVYTCDGCEIKSHGWCLYCEECEFNLHPMCGLEDGIDKEGNEVHDDQEVPDDGVHDLEDKNEGYICDGEVCYKA